MKQKTHFHGYSYFTIVPVFIIGICLFGTQEIFAEEGGNSKEDEFKVLTHNLYMREPILNFVPDWGNGNRAKKITDAEYIKGYDVVMFDEVFHNRVVDPFLAKLKDKEYPYQTPVLNRSKEGWDASENFDEISAWKALYKGLPGFSGTIEDGGVVIISKHPIKKKVQHFFTTKGCGFDKYSAKGFVYAKVEKGGKNYHIIATHVQAVDGGCTEEQRKGWTIGAPVREGQFKEIASFIKKEKIPSNEMVIIGGDMNVKKGTPEYDNMVALLNVNEPTYAGHTHTWDPKNNALAAYDFPYPENPPEYLDYIFIEKDHAQPPHWTNLAMDIDFFPDTKDIDFPDTRWEAGGGYKSHEISDHYPVAAFMSADDSTPKESNRRVKPYTHISLKSKHPEFEDKYIFIDPMKGDDYLKVNADETSKWTQFQFFKDSNPANPCLKHKDKIQVMMQYHPGYYLERFTDPTTAKHSAYPYRKAPNANLTLEIVSGANPDKCMTNGSVIRLKDKYYLKPWKKENVTGKWDGYLFFWDKSPSPKIHDFIVEFYPEYQSLVATCERQPTWQWPCEVPAIPSIDPFLDGVCTCKGRILVHVLTGLFRCEELPLKCGGVSFKKTLGYAPEMKWYDKAAY